MHDHCIATSSHLPLHVIFESFLKFKLAPTPSSPTQRLNHTEQQHNKQQTHSRLPHLHHPSFPSSIWQPQPHLSFPSLIWEQSQHHLSLHSLLPLLLCLNWIWVKQQGLPQGRLLLLPSQQWKQGSSRARWWTAMWTAGVIRTG